MPCLSVCRPLPLTMCMTSSEDPPGALITQEREAGYMQRLSLTMVHSSPTGAECFEISQVLGLHKGGHWTWLLT